MLQRCARVSPSKGQEVVMRRLGLAPVIGILMMGVPASGSAEPLWRAISEATAGRPAESRVLSAGRYGVYALDRTALTTVLDRAPLVSASPAKGARALLLLPLPDGRLSLFRIQADPPARVRKSRTFTGRGLTDRTASARLEIAPDGLPARISSAEGTVSIDPWGPENGDHFVSYYNKTIAGGSSLSVADATPVTEGNAGNTPTFFVITLSPASGGTVTVQADTADGTATVADNDYLPITAQTVTFGPGETSKTLTVSVVGDLNVELDETFSLVLSNASGAVIADGTGVGTIINDDFSGVQSPGELVHDSRENVELRSQGGAPRPRFWRVNQEGYRSYEVVLDAVTGDVAAAGLRLDRLASDGVTVLQSGTPVSGGSAVALRFKNSAANPNGSEFIRATTTGCANCDQNDTVRVRAYETTYRVSRFNNSATQVTVLVVSNSTSDPIAGLASFFAANGGGHLADVPFNLAPHATLVTNTSQVPGVVGAGSILISNDAPYGAITGKAVAVEPATGFTFDTPMVPRAASTKMVPRDN
jgi:hypothetical protein